MQIGILSMAKLKRLSPYFIGLFFITVCFQKSAASENFEVLTFSRHECFGSCPIYSVDVYSDGLMIFKGKRFISFIGSKRIQLDPNLYISLKTSIKDATKEPIDYFDCENFITDNPTVTVSLLETNGYLSASHNYGCTGYKGEDRLLKLVDKIQDMLPIDEWIKKDIPR